MILRWGVIKEAVAFWWEHQRCGIKRTNTGELNGLWCPVHKAGVAWFKKQRDR